MLCMYTMYDILSCICVLYIPICLSAHPSMHVYFVCILLCVYFVCILYVYYLYLLCMPRIYIPSKFVHLFIHLSISPSLHLLVYVWFFCILSIYTVYVSRCYTVYLCCICVSFMMMIKIMKNCFCKMVDQ